MRIDMTRTDTSVNMDRFYCVQLTLGLFGDVGVERLWGRRGTRGQQRLDWYENEPEATLALTDLVKKKLSRGYLLKMEPARKEQF